MELSQIRFLLGQVFSLLSAFSIIFSSFRREKHQILFWQFADSIFIALTDLCLGAYSAMIVNLIGVSRNAFMIKEKYSRSVMLIFLILTVFFGVISNNLGWVGWVAILASAEITVGVYIAKDDERKLMWVLLLNMCIWLTHDIIIRAYPVVLIEIITAISLVVHLIRWRKAQLKKRRKRKNTKKRK